MYQVVVECELFQERDILAVFRLRWQARLYRWWREAGDERVGWAYYIEKV